MNKDGLRELAQRYGVILDERRGYPSFEKRCKDEVWGINWTETLSIYEEFGKTCIHTTSGTRYRTRCIYTEQKITMEMIEQQLKEFVR